MAEQSQIGPGDCILSANGHDLTSLSKSEALQVIKAAGNHITLELIRPFSDTNTSSSDSSIEAPSYFQRIVHCMQYKREGKKSPEDSGTTSTTSDPDASPSQESDSEDHNAELYTKGKLPHKPEPENAKNTQNPPANNRKEHANLQENFGKHTPKAKGYSSMDALSHQSGPSEKDSTARSMDYGHTDSWKIAQQWAPQTPHLGGSEEGTQEQSGANIRTPRPPNVKKLHREAKNSQGDVLTFTNSRSTLPRSINGSKQGVRLVELPKGTGFLGLQLLGDEDEATPITVKAVLKGGAAYKSGKIHEGDEILEVNGVSFEKANLMKALKFMRKLPQGKVSLILRSGQDRARKRLFQGCQSQ